MLFVVFDNSTFTSAPSIWGLSQFPSLCEGPYWFCQKIMCTTYDYLHGLGQPLLLKMTGRVDVCIMQQDIYPTVSQ